MFCWIELSIRSCEIPFPKIIVSSDAALEKLTQSYQVFFLTKPLKIVDRSYY